MSDKTTKRKSKIPLPKRYSRTSIYSIWCGIKRRCRSKNCKAYNHYGALGIDVCEKWFDSFVAFYEDMGPKPSPKHSIDRIDTSKGYYKENCRWATPVEQSANARLRKDSSTGIRGVYWHKHLKVWTSSARARGKLHHLGCFDSPEGAAKARNDFIKDNGLILLPSIIESPQSGDKQ